MALGGIGGFVAGTLAASNSASYTLGGVYCGGIAMVLGGALLSRPRLFDGFCSYNLLVFSTIVCLASAIVAVTLSLDSVHFITHLEACSNEIYGISPSCGTTTDVECTGNSDYFPQAVACLRSGTNGDEGDSSGCFCVNNDGDCSQVENIDDCEAFLDIVPRDLIIGASFYLLVVLASLYILILLMMNRFPGWNSLIRSDDEAKEVEERNPLQPIS